MLKLIITCTEANGINNVTGSRISFYVKDTKSRAAKRLVHVWELPIKSARRSLSLFDSRYSEEFKKIIDTLCQSYNITEKNVDGFHKKKEKVAAWYKKLLKDSRARHIHRTPRQARHDRYERDKMLRNVSPETKELIKAPLIGTEE